MKKDVILKTAAELFAKYGYNRTSTAHLAEVAGVAEGTIFRHFKSKDHIFMAIMERLREKMSHEVYQYLEIQGEQPPIESIISMVKVCYLFVKKNSDDFTILLRDSPSRFIEPDKTTFGHSRLIYVLLQEYFQSAIERGQADNSIRKDLDPSDTACLIAASLMGIIRVVHLNFLQPSENILQNFTLSLKVMLQNNEF